MRDRLSALAREIACGLSELEPDSSKELLGGFVSELFLSLAEQSRQEERRRKQARGGKSPRRPVRTACAAAAGGLRRAAPGLAGGGNDASAGGGRLRTCQVLVLHRGGAQRAGGKSRCLSGGRSAGWDRNRIRRVDYALHLDESR